MSAGSALGTIFWSCAGVVVWFLGSVVIEKMVKMGSAFAISSPSLQDGVNALNMLQTIYSVSIACILIILWYNHFQNSKNEYDQGV